MHAHTHKHGPAAYYVIGWSHKCIITTFPQNLATARFYFKAQFGAATTQGWLDFEGGVYRDQHACVHTAKPICMHV